VVNETTTSGTREEPTFWRPLMIGIAVLAISHPVAANGFVTPFPVLGLLGLWRALRHPVLRRVALVAALWSGSTLLSAEVHGDKLVTQLALYGGVVFLASSAMFWLHERIGLRRETVVMTVAAGWFALTSVKGLRLDLPPDAWKFGLVGPVSMMCFGLAWRLRMPRVLVIGVLGGLTAISLLHDARFPAGLSVIVAAATLVHKRGLVSRASIIRQLVVFAVAVMATIQIYPPLAVRGYFGHRAQTQQTQLNAEGLNFLFANRPEMVQSAWIARHHPILGIGPGSALSTEEAAAGLGYLVRLGLPMDVNRQRYLLGQTESQNFANKGYSDHSSALNSIAQGGILAAPFWLYYAFLLIRMVLTRAREPVWAVPAIVWLSLFALWDVLFSPLIANQWPELSLAIFLAATSAREPNGSAAADEGDESTAADDGGAMLNSAPRSV
jgi:hypothetical protein